MHGLELPAAIAGALILLVVLWDTFETMVLPRSNTAGLRVTRSYFTLTWNLWRFIALRMRPSNPLRQTMLGVFGPLSLVLLIVLWANLLILGFGLLLFGVGSTIATNVGNHPGNFGDYLYLSGVTLFTLGYGDKTPASTPTKTLCIWEAGVGFGLLATVIGYLPTLYQTFARRETMVLRLYARAGMPSSAQSLVIRFRDAGAWGALQQLLAEWEQWGAELLESFRSYPMLAFYRSQEEEKSWLSAAIIACEVCEILHEMCPPDAPERPALILQAEATRTIIAITLRELAHRVSRQEDTPPAVLLSERLLLKLPEGRGGCVD